MVRLPKPDIFVRGLVPLLPCSLLLVISIGGTADAAIGQDTKTLATVNGDAITEAKAQKRASAQLGQVATQLRQCQIEAEKSRYTVLEQTVEVLIREQLIEAAAGKAGQDKTEWLQAQIAQQQEALTDEEVDDFFERNKNRLGESNRQQVEPQVRQYLASQAIYAELEEEAEIAYLLEPYRLDVGSEGPVRGGSGAPITIVEFSDFECPYCRQVVPTLEQALEKYEGKIKLVFRQFPLTGLHANAFKAAEAALCANDQDKFWELHDLMFDEQTTLAVSELEDKAKRLGLDVQQFATCVSSGRYADLVREELKAGAAIGVTGTPALFVNGRPLTGAVNLDQLSEVIDDELRRQEG